MEVHSLRQPFRAATSLMEGGIFSALKEGGIFSWC